MKQNDYIKERMVEFAMNIDDFSVGEIVTDSKGFYYRIIDKTINTIQVQMKAKTEKGIDCNQWFDMKDFNKLFDKISITSAEWFTEIRKFSFSLSKIVYYKDLVTSTTTITSSPRP